MVAHPVAVHLGAAQDEPFTAPGAPWQERLCGLARATRATMLAHRDGARLIATVADPGEQTAAAFGDLITALTTPGAPAETATHAGARSRTAVPHTPMPQKRTPPSCGGGVGR
ncbi:TetR/AcrR family transcriptional regulator C-terminal domain-containing protein [Actinomadura nitritigenes]|uniref:TetR/AcrR family transcriptional regulator C-terminal domain-containing protein n=1 Tax=Actinomadura nitritigenes TaxID=134602 RepID=UPI003D928457